MAVQDTQTLDAPAIPVPISAPWLQGVDPSQEDRDTITVAGGRAPDGSMDAWSFTFDTW